MTKKPKSPKFTFKKEPRETGLMAVGHPYPGVNVKLNGKSFGYINPASWSRKHWTVQYAIKREADDAYGGGWHWAIPKARFKDEQSARDWFQANAEEIAAAPLHFFEDDDQ